MTRGTASSQHWSSATMALRTEVRSRETRQHLYCLEKGPSPRQKGNDFSDPQHRPQCAPTFCWPHRLKVVNQTLCVGLSQPRRDTLQTRHRGVARQHQRIVTGNDVVGRVGQRADRLEGVVHLGQVADDAEGAILFDIGIVVRRIRSQDDPATRCLNADDLQSSRVPTDVVNGDSRHDLRRAVDEAEATGEVLANELQNVLRLHDPEEAALAGVAASPEGHLAVLHDKARVREVSDVPDMVVVEVGQNDVPDGLARDTELPQPLGWGVEEDATCAVPRSRP